MNELISEKFGIYFFILSSKYDIDEICYLKWFLKIREI